MAAAARLWRGVIEEYREWLPVGPTTPAVTLREGGKTGECWRSCALRDSLADPTPAVGTGIVTKLG